MKRIMFVDDNTDLTYVVKKRLEKLDSNYEVIGANSGKECFELLNEGKIPDLILLDIMMPDIDGWDIFAKLKENPSWRDIPIVFLTAKTDPYSRGFGKIPAQDYIEKPFEIPELKERLDRLLNQ